MLGAIFIIGHLLGLIVLLIYGLGTKPIETILFVVVAIPAAFLMLFLFFVGRCLLFCLLHRLGYVDGDWDGSWDWHLGKK